MPYIQPELRSEKVTELNPGILNYRISKLLWDYFNEQPGYQRINDVLGVLEGAKLEFYRRIAAPYEDVKMQANGDIV